MREFVAVLHVCFVSIVGACMLHVACCMLHVACCVLRVACFVLRFVLRVACCVLHVACCMLRVACCVVCCVLCVCILLCCPTVRALNDCIFTFVHTFPEAIPILAEAEFPNKCNKKLVQVRER
jgi:hypothetical protein